MSAQADVPEAVHDVAVLESPHTVRIFARVGTRLPATTSSTGKVLLAALDAAERDARLAGWVPQRPTRHSITDPEVLRRALAEVAERGWAQNGEESRLGVVSVGAPVRGSDGTVIAALSVATPVERSGPGVRRRHVAAVRDAAAVVSVRLRRV